MNVVVEEYPWTVEAKLNFSSNSAAKLVFQTQADLGNKFISTKSINSNKIKIFINKLGNDGYVRFTNLGLSDVTNTFVISYSFKTPEGVDK